MATPAIIRATDAPDRCPFCLDDRQLEPPAAGLTRWFCGTCSRTFDPSPEVPRTRHVALEGSLEECEEILDGGFKDEPLNRGCIRQLQ